VKRKRISTVLACIITLAMLIVHAIPLATAAAAVEIEFLNPLAEVDVPYDQPLAERLDTLEGKRVVLTAYTKDANSEALRALGQMLQKQYNCTVAYAPSLGSAWNEKTDANYNAWASYDAVVFGVAD
jgi:hypothetical protein